MGGRTAKLDDGMSGSRKALSSLAARVVSALVLASAGLFCSSERGSAASGSAAFEVAPLVRIGVLANRGTEQCLEQWGPMAEYLTTEIPSSEFQIRPLAHDEVAPAVARGELDLILVNPSLYIEMEWLHGAGRIVTLKNLCLGKAYTVYAGVIFCKADRDDIEEIADLKGKTFMAVEEDSFGGWQMAWRELKEHGLDPYRDFASLRFGETHDTVVDAVRSGETDAGTVRTGTLERMAAEGKIRLDRAQEILAEMVGN
jgi:two-component system sensor histidine kinase/response regulator